MQLAVITGNIGKDAEIRNAGGTPVCSFNVASKQGFGDKATTNWFRCSIWGTRAEKLGPYLLKGVNVTVSGELELSEYDGKTQLNIRVNDVALQGGRGDSKPAGGSQGGGAGRSDDLNDDWPGDDGADVSFMSCDWTADLHRKRVI